MEDILDLYHQPHDPAKTTPSSCAGYPRSGGPRPRAAFPAPEARDLACRFDFHFTQVHASWLNVAESEISVLVRQCLTRRIPDEGALRSESQAWEERRNETATKAKSQFTTADARIKLNSLYPQFD